MNAQRLKKLWHGFWDKEKSILLLITSSLVILCHKSSPYWCRFILAMRSSNWRNELKLVTNTFKHVKEAYVQFCTIFQTFASICIHDCNLHSNDASKRLALELEIVSWYITCYKSIICNEVLICTCQFLWT
jgi:hypothetical protein